MPPMTEQNASAPTWIALESDRSPMRAWVMDQAPRSCAVTTLAEAQALCPGAAVLVVGQPDATDAQPVPAKPAELAPKPAQGGGLWSLPALRQKSPMALMGGHAQRIEAFLSLNTNWDGVICLPGQTTIWALVSADEVVSFQPFATPQLLSALLPLSAEPDPAALRDVLLDVMSRPERMAAKLAEAQSGRQSGTLSDAEMAGWIWGACLGAELAAARPYWLGQNLALIAPDPLARPYQIALESQGLPITLADETRMTQLGLQRAWAQRLA